MSASGNVSDAHRAENSWLSLVQRAFYGGKILACRDAGLAALRRCLDNNGFGGPDKGFPHPLYFFSGAPSPKARAKTLKSGPQSAPEPQAGSQGACLESGLGAFTRTVSANRDLYLQSLYMEDQSKLASHEVRARYSPNASCLARIWLFTDNRCLKLGQGNPGIRFANSSFQYELHLVIATSSVAFFFTEILLLL